MPETDQELQKRNDKVRELVAALEIHCPGEGGHAERVAVYAVATAHMLGWNSDDLKTLRWASALHDIGKLSIDAELLQKPERLSESELEIVRRHPALGVRALADIPWLEQGFPWIRHHHERWDGKGYPDGLKGEAIPIGARIIAVAEAFDALTSAARYRRVVEIEEALNVLRSHARLQFDPGVVSAFMRVQPLIQPLRVS